MGIRRLAALAALLIGGVCAAMPYLKPAASPLPATETAASEPAPTTLQMPTIAIESPRGEVSSPVAPSGQPVAWHEPIPIVLPAGDEPLPMLPHVPITSRNHRNAAVHIHEPDFTSPPPAPPPVRPVERRRHRIVDGDSLSKLALRYLGDSSRGEEIARLNRDLIKDVNLLPIGREIVLPAPESE